MDTFTSQQAQRMQPVSGLSMAGNSIEYSEAQQQEPAANQQQHSEAQHERA
jgi:hypothetical protein